MDTRIVAISPQMAKEWLSHGRPNRNICENHVSYLAREFSEGRGIPTNQAIALDRNLRIIDGQHRLTAIIDSNKTVELLVASNCDPSVIPAIDTGKPRSLFDIIGGNKHTVESCAWLVKNAMGSSRKIPSVYVEPVIRILGSTFESIEAAARSNSKGRNVSTIRGVFGLRLHATPDSLKEELLRQWTAFVNVDTPSMDTTTGSFLRRCLDVRATSGGNLQNVRACIAWIAWNPYARNLQKIVLRNYPDVLQEIKLATLQICPEIEGYTEAKISKVTRNNLITQKSKEYVSPFRSNVIY